MMVKSDSKKRLKLFYLVIFSILYLISCDNKIKREDPKAIVQEWVGKEIEFPKNLPSFQLGKATNYDLSVPRPYRILVYTDSIGCTSCKLQLGLWKELIAEADTLMPNKISWSFYFSPKNGQDLSKLFIAENFRFPVVIDSEDEINKMNDLPKHIDYQTFLLDKDNHVLLLGNPTLKPSIWALYKKMINNKMDLNNK